MSIRDDFRRAMLVAARATVGVRESTRNSGPEIDEWLKYVHLKPGNSWCAAWVATMHDYGAKSVNTPNPCPRSGSVHTMWSLTLPECKVKVPFPGCVYFLEHSPTTGHAGIVDVVSPGGTVVHEISGNTFATTGGREGDQVAVHHGPPELTHGGKLLGYADYSELIPMMVGELPESPFK